MKILLVDDSEVLQSRLKRLIMSVPDVELVDQTYDVDTASEKIKNGSYDVVISDLRMPGKGGFELLTNTRKSNKKIKFIMLTNYALEQYESKAKELGADYFLSKADDLYKLVNIMNELSASSLSE